MTEFFFLSGIVFIYLFPIVYPYLQNRTRIERVIPRSVMQMQETHPHVFVVLDEEQRVRRVYSTFADADNAVQFARENLLQWWNVVEQELR